MDVILLGTAAGGGFPQWNCWCPSCRTARTMPTRARHRTQSSIAVSADGVRWLLCNASPDIRAQLAYLPVATPALATMRSMPIEGVILTDAELDHTLGLLLLREARALTLYAPSTVEAIIKHESRILPTLRAFTDTEMVCLTRGIVAPLYDRDDVPLGLSVEIFPVISDPPRFARGASEEHAVGLMIREMETGASLAFVPGAGVIDARLIEQLKRADAILFDGTCFTDDEMIRYKISRYSARQMGHVPISGPDGSLDLLRTLAPRTRIYTHINNTNPILIEDSEERWAVEATGVKVGHDGLRLTLQRPGQTLLTIGASGSTM